jgi:hypothetical protein
VATTLLGARRSFRARLARVQAPNDVHHEQRERFAAFLERFALGEVEREGWEQLVVNHYIDQKLERVRRECVRIRMRNEKMRWSPEERSRIEGWIRELRSTDE